MSLEATSSTAEPAAPNENDQHSKKEKRAAQSRINGAKSQGPITPEGKAKSSMNAIRHGLTANEHTLLSDEFPDEYDEVYKAFIEDLRPATKAELRLVAKIANLDWRLERLVMMETCVLNLESGINADKIMERFARIDGIGIIVEAWKESCSTSHCLDLLRRYMGTLQHQFNTTLANFLKFENRRMIRTRGGTNLDEEWGPPYKAPELETHLASQVDQPPPSPVEPGPTLVPPPARPIRNEPTVEQVTNEIALPVKRPRREMSTLGKPVS